MVRIFVLVAATLLSLAALPVHGAEPRSGLVEALALVPDTPAIRQQLIGYVDYRAVEVARPGAARPASWQVLRALDAAYDPSAALWNAATMGIASGSGALTRALYGPAGDWPAVVGFDPFDVDRELAFGSPPSDGLVLLGRFDPAAVAEAFAARDYTGTEAGGRTLLCGPQGCEGGFDVHPEQRDPANPFGGELGRSQPLAVSADDILSSASGETVRAMLGAADGAPSLATDIDYAAAAGVLSAARPVIQATFVPAALVQTDIAGMLSDGGDAARDELEKLAAVFEPMPPYRLLAFADGATAKEQVVTIALVYERADDAHLAAEVIPRRLEALPSLRVGRQLRTVLDEQGVHAIEGKVLPSPDGVRTVAVITLRAPLAPGEPEPGTGFMTQSSLVYRMLATMLMGRDTLWLAPTLPDVG